MINWLLFVSLIGEVNTLGGITFLGFAFSSNSQMACSVGVMVRSLVLRRLKRNKGFGVGGGVGCN